MNLARWRSCKRPKTRSSSTTKCTIGGQTMRIFWSMPSNSIKQSIGRAPRLLAADAAFYSARNEAAAKAMGVKRVCIPNRSIKSLERKREQKKPWFRNGQKWRTGCEGRVSVIKRRHGLSRCRYRGEAGMKRWVGLGVISDNLINIGRAITKQSP